MAQKLTIRVLPVMEWDPKRRRDRMAGTRTEETWTDETADDIADREKRVAEGLAMEAARAEQIAAAAEREARIDALLAKR